MESLKSVFVYGTLMQGQANHSAYIAPHPFRSQPGHVDGTLYHLPEGYPALIPGKGTVLGEWLTYEGPANDFAAVLESLDRLEGYLGDDDADNLYVRHVVQVSTTGGAYEAYCYMYADAGRAEQVGTLVTLGDWQAFTEQPKRTLAVVVDADACPRAVLATLRDLQHQHGYRLTTVASFNHVIGGGDHITVGNGPDEADLAIANRIRSGDIVVTQDWGLAALVLGKGARAISPMGHIYDPNRIDFMLDERHKKAGARRAGVRTRGPKARTKTDDARFRECFLALLGATT